MATAVGTVPSRRKPGPQPILPDSVRAELAGRALNNEMAAVIGRQYGVNKWAAYRIVKEHEHGPQRMWALQAATQFYRRNSAPASSEQSERFPISSSTAKARKRALHPTLEPACSGAGSSAAVGSTIQTRSKPQDSQESGIDW